MGGACSSTCAGEERCIQSLGGKTEGKRPLGIPRCRWEDNIKMDLQEVRLRGMDLAQDRNRWWAVVNVVIIFHVS
jgi:hypothetical protein